ncbi:hypothetical protein KH5H1_72820 [Corallococcus caeni]|nr:hypothetical protein KH5H1_72820 [Corallococcus sp. KH5-1]
MPTSRSEARAETRSRRTSRRTLSMAARTSPETSAGGGVRFEWEPIYLPATYGAGGTGTSESAGAARLPGGRQEGGARRGGVTPG